MTIDARGRRGPARRLAAWLMGAGALLAGGAPLAAAAPTDFERHEVTAAIRSSPDGWDFLQGDGSSYASPGSPTFILDSRDSSEGDVFWLFTGKNRRFTLNFSEPERTVVCDGASSISFRSHATPQWYDATAQPDDSVLGDVVITCRQRDGGSSDGYRVRYPGTPDDPAADCVIARRVETSGAPVYEFAPRAPSPGRDPEPPPEPSPLDPVYDLLGAEDEPDPGEPATPGCPAKVYEVTRNGRGNYTERFVAEIEQAPFLIRGQVTS